MEGIGDKGLGVEVPAPKALGDGHEEVDKQPNTGNPNTGIVLILAGEVDVFAGRVMVMVTNAMGMRVPMGPTRVVTSSVNGGHGRASGRLGWMRKVGV